MSVATATACPVCHRPVRPDDLACDLCGHLLRRASGAAVAPTPSIASIASIGSIPAAAANAVAPPPPPPPVVPDARFDPPPLPAFVTESAWSRPLPRIAGMPEPWFFLAAGLLLAPILTFTPMLRYVGWFLGSLCHETGHAATGWYLGCPSVPAIRIDGHAAAIHQAQSKFLCGLVLVALGGMAWRDRARRPRLAAWLAALATYPLLAFTDAREAAFLFAGHLGELAFATYFLSRAIDGGFTGSAAERATHAMVGWFLVGRNVWLAGGLVWKESMRDWYAESGSFGLVNDYLRLAREVFASSIAVPATAMLVASLLVLPVALAIGRLTSE